MSNDERCPKCGATEAEMMSVDMRFDPPRPYHAGKIEISTLTDLRHRYICGRCGGDLPLGEPMEVFAIQPPTS